MTNRGRARWLFWLRLAFGLAVLLLLAFRMADLRTVIAALGALRPEAFLLALVVNVASSIVVPAVITSHTMRAGNLRFSMGELVRINLAMRFYVLVLPHAITVGMRWLRYRGDQPGRGWQAAALIAFERVIYFAVLLGFAFVFLVVAGAGLPSGLRVLLPLSAILAAVGLVAVLMFVAPPVYGAASPLARAIARRSPRFIASRIDSLLEAVSAYQRLGQRRVGFVVAWSVAGYLLFVTSAWIISRDMALPVGFVDVGWMRSAVLLMTLLPVTVGGIGVREAGFAGLLYLYGADRSVALAFPLALLAIQLLIGVAGALVELGRVVRQRSAARASS